jgi:hypothetical protein
MLDDKYLESLFNGLYTINTLYFIIIILVMLWLHGKILI